MFKNPLFLFLIFLIILVLPLLSITTPASTQDSTPIINETQQAITNHWINLNYNLDLFFSEQPYAKSENKSLIFAYYSFYKKEGQPVYYNSDIRASIHLPQTSQRLRIVIEKESDILNQQGNVASGPGPGQDSSARPDARDNFLKAHFIAGISYLLPKTDFVKIFVDTGMRLNLPLDPFAKLNIQKNIETKYINIFASQRFLLYRQDGFLEVTQLSFSKRWNAMFQSEQVNTLSWTDKYDLFFLRNNLSLQQIINERNSLFYIIGANADFTPTFFYSGYDTVINYRRLLYSDWLFMDFSIGADYPKSDKFKMQPFTLAKMQVFFR
ncbi:MAG: hypothetical protein HQK49_06495 [Oligoflexia bacterium]|nr:hypothetical protein [Oligoflexia bacterium]